MRCAGLFLALLLCVGCGTDDAGTSTSDGGWYEDVGTVRTPAPTPGVTFVEVFPDHFMQACPAARIGGPTPHVEEECVMPRGGGRTRYGHYSTVLPSVRCKSGKLATEYEGFGIGYVAEPLLEAGTAEAGRIATDCPPAPEATDSPGA